MDIVILENLLGVLKPYNYIVTTIKRKVFTKNFLCHKIYLQFTFFKIMD